MDYKSASDLALSWKIIQDGNLTLRGICDIGMDNMEHGRNALITKQMWRSFAGATYPDDPVLRR